HLRYHTVLTSNERRAIFVGSVWAPDTEPVVEVLIGDQRYRVTTTRRGQHVEFDHAISVDRVPLWWPHTHGDQGGLAFTLTVDGVPQRNGTLRFRRIELDRAGGKVGFVVNDVPVFVRGACWTVSDLKSLQNEPARLRALLENAKNLGLNMLRIGGTMAYEDDGFYALCDELGLMVWQDFMFANMDYPFADDGF